MELAIKAYTGDGTEVVYEYADGHKEIRSGGSRSWRNNNPGNIRYVAANDWNGQIGKAGGFSCFSHPDFGRRAIGIILKKYASRGLTLGKAIRTYAPAVDNNNEEAYIKHVEELTKISRKTALLAVLDRLPLIAQAIEKHEGYFIGNTEKMEPELSANHEEVSQLGEYIWRTARDNKVRSRHAAREGKTFKWREPPQGGHPGEEYGCRCWAEPIVNEEKNLGQIFDNGQQAWKRKIAKEVSSIFRKRKIT